MYRSWDKNYYLQYDKHINFRHVNTAESLNYLIKYFNRTWIPIDNFIEVTENITSKNSFYAAKCIYPFWEGTIVKNLGVIGTDTDMMNVNKDLLVFIWERKIFVKTSLEQYVFLWESLSELYPDLISTSLPSAALSALTGMTRAACYQFITVSLWSAIERSFTRLEPTKGQEVFFALAPVVPLVILDLVAQKDPSKAKKLMSYPHFRALVDIGYGWLMGERWKEHKVLREDSEIIYNLVDFKKEISKFKI